MTLKIYDTIINVQALKEKLHEAELSAQKVIKESKTTDRKKFLVFIESILLLYIRNKTPMQKINDWIWNYYKVELSTQYLSTHIKELREKHNLNK